jgi:hypothetical protein
MINTNNINDQNLLKDIELLNTHISNKDYFWASVVQAKIENAYNVKIVKA